MAGDASPPAVYNARLRRVVFSSREQHESDLRWVIFARSNQNLGGGKAGHGRGGVTPTAPLAPPEQAPPSTGASYVGMDSRESKRTIAHQSYVDAALRSVIDLPSLRQY